MEKNGLKFNEPIGPVLQIEEITKAKPFRHLMMGLFYKNSTIEDATDSACHILDHILLTPCDITKHLVLTLTDCDSRTNKKQVTYSWTMINGTQNCRDDGQILPEPVLVTCRFVSRKSPLGMAICITALIGIVCCLGVGVLVWFFRTHKVLKSASPVFCFISLAGTMLISADLFFVVVAIINT